MLKTQVSDKTLYDFLESLSDDELKELRSVGQVVSAVSQMHIWKRQKASVTVDG